MKPKKLFLIDAFGALFSCIMLGFVLVTQQKHVGMPIDILQFLAIIAFVYSLFSIGNFYFPSSRLKRNLKIIAIANTVYCFITVGLVLVNLGTLKPFGFLYFIAEILIILILAKVEWSVANS